MRYLLTFMMLLVVSFVEASPAPNWVLGRGHPNYDPSQYLMGVGFSKENTVSASESARAELIKSIRVKVNSTLKDYKSNKKSFSEATISSESDFLLEGSQVKDGWYDEEKEIFYSLVVIKRQYVLDTLSDLIQNIVSKNSLTLRQADTFYNNDDILKALVYYYDGYVESSKLLPYIQTYKSVIMEPTSEILEENYNLLFKEKIQNIVEHIEIEKIDSSVKDNNVSLKVKVLYKGRGISFPIKFYSVYKHHVERVFCKKDGCETKTLLTGVLNKENRIFIKAVPDLQTFEKLFTYNLSERLFNRIGLLNVAFKDTLQNQKDIAEEKYYAYMNKELDKKMSRDPFTQAEREVQNMRKRQYYNCRDYNCIDSLGGPRVPRASGHLYNSGLFPNNRVGHRTRGNINFNIGFGKGRNRGNINIHKEW